MISPTHPRLRIGTRSSALARWQADWTAAQLRAAGYEVELVYITTQGDVKTGALGQIGGQGLFTKEIQRALATGEVDIAVHSLKDLPTAPTPGLVLGAVPPRESVSDALVSVKFPSLASLPQGARVGTGSLRRKTQLLHVRPDLEIAEIRGNVDTRLKKLDAGEFEAIVLAHAGLNRLGWADRIRELLPCDHMLPAVGQGALGIEIRADDLATRSAVSLLDHFPSHAAVMAERAMLAELRGGCLAPVGAWGRCENADRLVLEGVVLNETGRERIFARAEGDPATEAHVLGRTVAHALLSQGAERLIAGSRSRGGLAEEGS